MTGEEKVQAVTKVLAGEFYVGQLVRTSVPDSSLWHERIGTVREINNSTRVALVDLGEYSDGEWIPFHSSCLRLL